MPSIFTSRRTHAEEELHPSAASAENIIKHNNTDKVIIVGAGPAGLATAACLRARNVPFVIIERTNTIASLWKQRTYDRLKMHIAKDYCQLPLAPFPESFPTFVSRKQFIEYIDQYVNHFDLQPRFNEGVVCAHFDENERNWVVETLGMVDGEKRVYIGRWLVVATGENADMAIPDIPGRSEFRGSVVHSSQYKNGASYKGKKVVVIGCGNSGMEIALDLHNNGAHTSVVVRSPFHVLPLEVLGKSTFSVATRLMKSLPVWLVDCFLVSYARVVLGDTAAVGIHRPKIGPLELKTKMGKTPVLDVGTLARIKSGDIKVKPAVECIMEDAIKYANGSVEKCDAIVFATGYRSNVLKWLKDTEQFFGANSMPKSLCPRNWKGKNGLYVAGLCNKGILGGATDAELIAADIFAIQNNVSNDITSRINSCDATEIIAICDRIKGISNRSATGAGQIPAADVLKSQQLEAVAAAAASLYDSIDNQIKQHNR